MGFVQHLNGAVVPQDTTSVLAQKQLHMNAHATAVNGYKYPFVINDVAPLKVDGAHAIDMPLTRTVARPSFVQDVQDQPIVPMVTTPLVTYTHPYQYSIRYAIPPVSKVPTHPYTYGGYLALQPYMQDHPLTNVGVHTMAKREAEADTTSYYGGYYGYPVYYAPVPLPKVTYGRPYWG